jgi:hypothetical protein
MKLLRTLVTMIGVLAVAAGSAFGANQGSMQDARLSGNRVTMRLSSPRLAAGKMDERDREEALQTVTVKTPAPQNEQKIRAVSSEMRAQKTRRVVANQ